MSSSEKVEDLVKKALKEAMEKRKVSATTIPPEIASVAVTDEVSVVEKPTEDILKLVKVKSNQKMFSVVTGNLVDLNLDFPVTVFYDYKWDERIASFIPEVDPEYVIDTDLAMSILRAWEMNEKVLCYGPTGAGKSSLVEQLCARTARPFVRINCTGDMDSSMIFGQLTAKDGSTQWVDGAVTEAVRYGAVFAWDEWDVTPPEISMGLQWLLEDNGKLFLKEMPGNTKDRQNSATLDRFGTAVYIGYLAPDVEEKMIQNKWSSVITKKATKELVKLANLVRQGYITGQLNLTLSPRSLFSICKKLSYGSTLSKAYQLVYLNKLSDTQRKVANELFVKIYGSSSI